MNIIKSVIKSIAKGFYLLGEGFSYMNLYPSNITSYPRLDYKSYDDNQASREDNEAIKRDWEKTGRDLEEIITKSSDKKNLK